MFNEADILPVKAEAVVVKMYKYFCKDRVTEQQSCCKKPDVREKKHLWVVACTVFPRCPSSPCCQSHL